MKKLFTLFVLLLVFGVFSSNAQSWDWTFNYYSDDISGSNIYEYVTTTATNAANQPLSDFEVDSDTYSFTSSDSMFYVTFTPKSGYNIEVTDKATDGTTIPNQNSSVEEGYKITLNPGTTQIYIKVSKGEQQEFDENTYVDFTFNIPADATDFIQSIKLTTTGDNIDFTTDGTKVTGKIPFGPRQLTDYLPLYVYFGSKYTNVTYSFKYTLNGETTTLNGASVNNEAYVNLNVMSEMTDIEVTFVVESADGTFTITVDVNPTDAIIITDSTGYTISLENGQFSISNSDPVVFIQAAQDYTITSLKLNDVEQNINSEGQYSLRFSGSSTVDISVESTLPESYEVTFKFVGADGLENAYEYVNVGTQNPMDVNLTLDSDTYLLEWNQYAGILYIKAVEGYKISNIASSVPTIVSSTESGADSTGRWNDYSSSFEGVYGFSINPDKVNNGAVITITIAKKSDGDDDDEGDEGDTVTTYTIPVSYDKTLVESVNWNGEALIDGNIVAEYDSSRVSASKTGYLNFTLVEDAEIESATATLVSKEGADEVTYELADGSISFEIDFTVVTSISVVFNKENVEDGGNDGDGEDTNSIITFVLAGSEDAYTWVDVKTSAYDDDTLNLTTNEFDIEFTSAGAILYVNAKEGYTITNVKSDVESIVDIATATSQPDGGWRYYDGVYTFVVYDVEACNNAMITITLEAEKTGGVSQLINSLDENDVIYNVNGVRVNAKNITRGIYIINGKKVLVK